jgi:hypothetical protein
MKGQGTVATQVELLADTPRKLMKGQGTVATQVDEHLELQELQVKVDKCERVISAPNR